MSVTNKTSFYLQGAPLPPNFRGTPQELFEAMLARTQIVSPFAIATVVVGGAKPATNQGPWLSDGSKWYVWSEEESDYVPVDITDSMPSLYWVQATEPESHDPPLWLQTDASNSFVALWYFLEGAWRPLTDVSGPTASRPAAPLPFQKYYDTTIQAHIWYERGAWRTVDGVRGDVKFVSWPTAEEALSRNPGWEILGTGETDNVNWRGRVIGQATKNPGGSATTSLTTAGGVSEREQAALFGAETHALTVDEMPAHDHGLAGRQVKVDVAGGSGDDGNAYSYQAFQSSGGGAAHNNLQPTLALWTLRKA